MHYPFVKPEDENTSGSRKRRAARIVDGINCAPYDQAYARGYLWAFGFHPLYVAQVQTCLGIDLTDYDGTTDFLSSGEWGQGYNKFSIYLFKKFYLISLYPTINVF